jgi:GDP/UDP-N,N'-diacetylbacillosamine 2-epimerase (hydrolysing)
MIDSFVRNHPETSHVFTSLGQLRYFSLLRFVDAVVGNSSSGIIEAPSFRIGTINIGDRQKGRIRAASVIDCGPNREEIRKAIKTLYSESFQKKLGRVTNPYGDGKTGPRIKRVLKQYKLNNIMKKVFYQVNS